LIQEIRDHHFPVVAIDRRVPGLELDFIGTDNVTAAYAATRHLIEQGHRRIAHLTSLGMTDAASERLTGYQQALLDNGLEANPRHILLTLDGGRRLDREMLRQVFTAPDAPTALFLLADYWAPVVYDELRELGLRVPEDVALVGFDDVVQPGLEDLELTSMAQDFEGIGKKAAEIILDRLDKPALAPQVHTFSARLVVRRSSLGNERVEGALAQSVAEPGIPELSPSLDPPREALVRDFRLTAGEKQTTQKRHAARKSREPRPVGGDLPAIETDEPAAAASTVAV